MITSPTDEPIRRRTLRGTADSGCGQFQKGSRSLTLSHCLSLLSRMMTSLGCIWYPSSLNDKFRPSNVTFIRYLRSQGTRGHRGKVKLRKRCIVWKGGNGRILLLPTEGRHGKVLLLRKYPAAAKPSSWEQGYGKEGGGGADTSRGALKAWFRLVPNVAEVCYRIDRRNRDL